jgi:predicted nucleic acid-binding protein
VILVADASPLIVLARSALLAVVRAAAGPLIVPASVFAEATVEAAKPGAREVARARDAGDIDLRDDPAGFASEPAPAALGTGERAALALARELSAAVLMDDRAGREFARCLGLTVIGSAGLLIALKKEGRIGAVGPILETWRAFGYRLAPDLVAAIKVRAGET